MAVTRPVNRALEMFQKYDKIDLGLARPRGMARLEEGVERAGVADQLGGPTRTVIAKP